MKGNTLSEEGRETKTHLPIRSADANINSSGETKRELAQTGKFSLFLTAAACVLVPILFPLV
jgi:hypothetical protein